MGHTEHAASRIRFGVFEADLKAGELRKQGVKVKLADQPFVILAMLLERPGEVVTREELQGRLWAADTFVDFDRGLNKAINRLREALGDSADAPHFVETLPKRGYRFLGAVDNVLTSPPLDLSVRPQAPRLPSDLTSEATPDRSRVGSRARWKTTAWSAALLALVLSLAWIPARRPSNTEISKGSPLVRALLIPPSGTAFVSHSVALSQDGSRMAFVAETAEGSRALWIRSLGAADAQLVNGTEGVVFPFWAPDQQRIGFFADRKLKIVDVAGGAVRVIADAPRASGGTWNAKDVIVFAPDVNGSLYQVPAGGGTPTPISIRPDANDARRRWPVFLPDGVHFLHVVLSQNATQDTASIVVGSLDSAEPTLIMSEGARNVVFALDHLFFVRGDTLYAQPFDPVTLHTTGPPVPVTEREVASAPVFFPSAFSVSQTGLLIFQSSRDFATRLTWIDSSGKELGSLPDATLSGLSLSPDGRSLALSCDEFRSSTQSICVHDLARGVSARVTTGPSNRYPVWSRDGKEIAYTSDGGIYRVAADGSGSPQLISRRGIPTDWTDDGRILSFGSKDGVVSLALSSIATHEVTELGPGSEGQISPDGHWLVHGGDDGIVVRRFPDLGGRVQVSTSGASQPRWSRDGRHIYYIRADKKLMGSDFNSSPATVSAPRVLLQTRIIAAGLTGFQYDVAPDGRFLINSLASNSSPLTLVTGWTARLKR